MNELPLVSVILPCRNEGRFIQAALESIVANDFPKDRLEVLVVDGLSEDGTRPIVSGFVQKYPFIHLLDNPLRITPAALNVGIRRCQGRVVVRMDAHARYDGNYISMCVDALQKHDADNVGGTMITVPRDPALVGRGVAAALSHRFGVGASHFRVPTDRPMYVDTVFGGCYRREVFDRVGLFNEKLVRGQDMEFNLRLRKAGGRTLLIPDIRSTYYARSDLGTFLKHNFTNGEWVVLPFLFSPIMPVRWRHLVPLAFVLSLLGAAVLTFFSGWGLALLAGIAVAYGVANLLASIHVAVRERSVSLGLVMPWIFAGLHVSYGLGSLWGLIEVFGRAASGWIGRRTHEAVV